MKPYKGYKYPVFIQYVIHIESLGGPSQKESGVFSSDNRRYGIDNRPDYKAAYVISIIIAVEHSLDAYKFNLLHCKQSFIAQLKRRAMGTHVIDEGSSDEKTGMNYSEIQV